jgi:hypothetical protein
MVILADNSAYEAGGAGNPCPPGNFNKTYGEVFGQKNAAKGVRLKALRD